MEWSISLEPELRDWDASAADTRLLAAAKRGDAAAARRLLRAGGANPSAADCQGVSALLLATEAGSVAVVEHLLRAGADAAAISYEGFTALHAAAHLRRSRIARLLIAAGAPLEARTHFGVTPLYSAAKAGDVQTCEALLAAGADVAAVTDAESETVLHGAAVGGNPDVISLLLAASGGAALLDARADNGRTPLMLAANPDDTRARMEADLTATVAHLIAAGADVDARGVQGTAPLLLAADGSSVVVDPGRPSAVGAIGPYQGAINALLAAGACPAAADCQGVTPAACAATAAGQMRVQAGRLGPRLAAEARRMEAAYEAAARQLGDAAAGLPPQAPWPVEGGPNDPRHAQLMAAAAAGDVVTVERLLALPGVNPNTFGGSGPSPPTLLLAASGAGHARSVAALLRAGADARLPGGSGQQALHAAAKEGRVEVMRLLLAAGARVDARTGTTGATPLWLAAAGGHGEAVRVLLEAGADPAARDREEGMTTLHAAARAGSAPAATALLAHPRGGGALAAARDKKGRTPLHIAAVAGCEGDRGFDRGNGVMMYMSSGVAPGPGPDPALVGLLLAAGADPATRDHRGCSALDAARAALRADPSRRGAPTAGAASQAVLAAVVARLEAAAASGSGAAQAGTAGAAAAKVCSVCGAHQGGDGAKLRLCAGCRQRRYCGHDCQTQDWKAGHKHQCQGRSGGGSGR
ncbi:MAG: ankyrin repeat-containing domain protein [Monoraphidium minutum]|nr:MAG: ankyrin repeat-containing domain protein [Monoraphidium minutum]